MTELKTLKDLQNNSDRPEMVEPEEIRQEAVKWIKKLQNEIALLECNDDPLKPKLALERDSHKANIEWIKMFFNINPEEETKYISKDKLKSIIEKIGFDAYRNELGDDEIKEILFKELDL